MNSKGSGKAVLWLVLVTILSLVILYCVPVSAHQVGTTLTANKTAISHAKQTFGPDIAKSVPLDTWIVVIGETGIERTAHSCGHHRRNRENCQLPSPGHCDRPLDPEVPPDPGLD